VGIVEVLSIVSLILSDSIQHHLLNLHFKERTSLLETKVSQLAQIVSDLLNRRRLQSFLRLLQHSQIVSTIVVLWLKKSVGYSEVLQGIHELDSLGLEEFAALRGAGRNKSIVLRVEGLDLHQSVDVVFLDGIDGLTLCFGDGEYKFGTHIEGSTLFVCVIAIFVKT